MSVPNVLTIIISAISIVISLRTIRHTRRTMRGDDE